jgi:hypothetical protein
VLTSSHDSPEFRTFSFNDIWLLELNSDSLGHFTQQVVTNVPSSSGDYFQHFHNSNNKQHLSFASHKFWFSAENELTTQQQDDIKAVQSYHVCPVHAGIGMQRRFGLFIVVVVESCTAASTFRRHYLHTAV